MRKLLLIDLHRPVQAVLLWAVRVGSEGCKFIFGYVSSSAICGHLLKCGRLE